MTHLEILAERLDKLAEEAMRMSGYLRCHSQPLLAERYHGEVVAFGRSADMLRQEALERIGTDEEAKE